MAQPAAEAAEGEGQSPFGGNMMRFMVQMVVVSMVMNAFTSHRKPTQKEDSGGAEDRVGLQTDEANLKTEATERRGARPQDYRNLYGRQEECDLFVHVGETSKMPSLAALFNETLASQEGLVLLWHEHVWYRADATAAVNVSLGPVSPEVLSGEAVLHLHATLLRTALLEDVDEIPPEQVVANSVPVTVKLRELSPDAGAENLFTAEDNALAIAPRNGSSSNKVPYFKTKIEIRPVYDHTVHSAASLQQGPFKRLALHPKLGVYEPYLYVSDFWLLEKDYLPLNESLAGRGLNLSLTYNMASLFVWSIQAQMAEQWMTQGEWGLTDTQRDSFMLKRLLLDTNPYLLAFSGLFILLHTLFSMLAFKNDIQFWRNNESMQGLSARSMCVSFVCQLITSLYLLDSKETSRLILFEIILETALAFWKLKKAVKLEFRRAFPFVSIAGQKGYDQAGTSKYDEEAIRYMNSIITPLFLGFCIRSAIYGKHYGWYSFLVGSAAGGVYTFGFVMMTPQLYINYKLKSVEHLPWRALTYKAMNTFVDDIAALLIDMPLMHRLSCFRDDIVFFIYIYQRWKYRVDKTRPTMWAEQPVDNQQLVDGGGDVAAPAAASHETAPAKGQQPAGSEDVDIPTGAPEKAAPAEADR